jgi:hypothetical protein
VGVTGPRRFPSVAWSEERVNPEFGGKTGKNPRPYAARVAMGLGELLHRMALAAQLHISRVPEAALSDVCRPATNSHYYPKG